MDVESVAVVFKNHSLQRITMEQGIVTVRSSVPLGDTVMNFYNWCLGYAERTEHPLPESTSKKKKCKARLTPCIEYESRLFVGLDEQQVEEILQANDLIYQFHSSRSEVEHCFASILQNGVPPDKNCLWEQKETRCFLFGQKGSPKDESVSSYKPIQIQTTFGQLNGCVVAVYTASSLTELLALDYFYALCQEETEVIALCKECKRMYRPTNRNGEYCSKECRDTSYMRAMNNDPYHLKYTNLRKNLHKKVVAARGAGDEREFAYREVFSSWREWAEKERRAISKTYHSRSNWSCSEQAVLMEDFPPYREKSAQEEILSPEEFAEKLKNKWNELLLKEGLK